MKHALMVLALFVSLCTPLSAVDRLPNFVIIFADDLGYGDLSCYGHPTINTPELDAMADQGMRFTQFYATANCCTPSRAALLTGRYPIRSGMCGDGVRVLYPNSKGGMPDSEITLAEALKTKGYATACIGKWHLGHLPPYLPTKHGFDYYYGLPYSNDMWPANKGRGFPPLPLFHMDKIIGYEPDQTQLTRQYTEHAIRFIKENKDKPFFLYMPHTFPHTPLFVSDKFKNVSQRGLYGDVVEELDWSVGQVLKTLDELELDENTLVIFTSDNGPWLQRKVNGGSAGLLRKGKGTTWEGGHREPCIARWPGQIKAGITNHEVITTLDIFTTCLSLAGVDIPQDRIIDGRDISRVLKGTGPAKIQPFFYYRGTYLMAVRKGPWKLHVITSDAFGGGAKKNTKLETPLLYHLEHDPSERYDVARQNPQVVADLLKEIAAHKATIKPVKSQLTGKMPEI